MSCDEVQGYYIAHPMPAYEALALIQRGALLPLPEDTAVESA
jgi:EAL domain-containing protein (putative c-di-GMP-specific phosphodiesterase class I)